MPDPVPPGPIEKVKRFLGLRPRKAGMALLEGQPTVAMKPTPPKVVTEAPGTPSLIPGLLGNIYNGGGFDEMLLQPVGVELPPMTKGAFLNSGLPDTLLGGHCVSQNVLVDARGTFNISKTYAAPPGTVFGPGLVAYLETKMTGCTELNQTWGTWATDCNLKIVTNAQHTWSSWASNAYTVPTGTITIQTTSGITSNHLLDSSVIQNTWSYWNKQYVETKEQKEKRLLEEKRQQELWLEHQRTEAARVAKVKARAEKILVRNLTTEQALMLREKNYFDVDVGDKVYRIHRGTHGNIKELGKDGKPVASLCVQPNNVPTEDAMLAQLLWLRADEKALLRVANRTQLRVQ